MDIQAIIQAVTVFEIELAKEQTKAHFERGHVISQMNMIAFD